jgi:hypothetical protein
MIGLLEGKPIDNKHTAEDASKKDNNEGVKTEREGGIEKMRKSNFVFPSFPYFVLPPLPYSLPSPCSPLPQTGSQ